MVFSGKQPDFVDFELTLMAWIGMHNQGWLANPEKLRYA